MKKYHIIALTAAGILASVPCAHASNVGISLGVNLGTIAAQFSANPEVAFAGPPEFVARPGLDFYFAIGTPYDLFYSADRYYLCRGASWFAAPYYDGPWVRIDYDGLPRALRRYPLARLRYFRDDVGRHYRDEGIGYAHFRPALRGGEMRGRWGGRGSCGMGR